jgi:hypothetical protein
LVYLSESLHLPEVAKYWRAVVEMVSMLNSMGDWDSITDVPRTSTRRTDSPERSSTRSLTRESR